MNKNESHPKYQTYIGIFLTILIVCLLAVIGLVVVVDPFFQYHKPVKGLYYTIDNQLSQNPGMAKNFDYDSVILGSSMTVNFDTDLFARTLGRNTLKLSYNGAYPKDIDEIMKIVKDSPNEVKEVFLGVDIYTYKTTPGITAYPLPSYLYDNNPLNDVSYWFNKDVLINYIVAPQLKRESTPLNQTYWSWVYMPQGKGTVVAGYSAPTEYEEMQAEDIYTENIGNNLEECIIPYIESMPDTEFTIFFPPYSILYWNTRMADGSLAAELSGEKQIIETLLAYPNVRIFYFQNDFDYITNLDNYCDYTHYGHGMNDYMTACFGNGDWEVTGENYEAVLQGMEEYLENVREIAAEAMK